MGRILNLNGHAAKGPEKPREMTPDADGVLVRHSISPSVQGTRYTREGWLKARGQYVTGSDAAVIVGGAKWSSPIQIWAKKTGVMPDDEVLPERMEIGSAIETFLGQMLARRAGIQIARLDDVLFTNPDHPLWAFSADGLVVSTQGSTHQFVAGVETKNVSEWASKADDGSWDWENEVPPHVEAQVQFGMAVLDLPRFYVGALIGGNRFVWHEVRRDEAWVARHRDELNALGECLRSGEMPEQNGTDADREALRHVFPTDEKRSPVALSGSMLEMTEEREEVMDQIKALEDQKKSIENQVLAALAGAPAGLLPDGRKWTHKATTRKASVTKASTYMTLRAPRKAKRG